MSILAKIVLVALPAWLVQLSQAGSIPPLYRVHAFYYLWYSEPSTGGWAHWDHEVLPHWDSAVAKDYPKGIRFEPPDCLHSPYYPLRGPYSSTSLDLIRQHLQEFEQYGIGVLVASWWGPPWRQGSHDTQKINTDDRIEQVIKEIEASESPVRVAFHLEPYEGRTKHTVYEDLIYLAKKYAHSPSVLRFNGRPVYYVYDSYRLPASDWAQLLRRNEGPLNVRGTPADGFFLGLWLDQNDGDEKLLPAGFEGFYTYFSSEQVSYGSNPFNWPKMQKWATSNNLLFVPSIGPGYHDGKIRPWNSGAMRDRGDGARYRKLWEIVLGLGGVQFVSITSYNEWGEGTQIEPAVARASRHDCSYLSYEPKSSYFYLDMTRNGSLLLGQQAALEEEDAESCSANTEGGASGGAAAASAEVAGEAT